MVAFERVYPHPSEIRCCCNCPAIERRATSMPVKMWCTEFDQEVTREAFRDAMDGIFPDFCKLEKSKHGKTFPYPIKVRSCSGCPSIKRVGTTKEPLRFRCREYKKEVDGDTVIDGKVSEICNLVRVVA